MASGLQVRQDIKTAVRFVMFETEYEGWEYGTHGGTCFVVLFRGKPYCLTARHVLQDFAWSQLCVTSTKFGRQLAGLKGVYYPSVGVGAAEGSDLLDIAAVELADDVDAAFFADTAYILDQGTFAQSTHDDRLLVHGALKAESTIGDDTIAPVFATLEFQDAGGASHDAAVRKAIALFDRPEFQSVEGLSGAPVFNLTRNALSGMVVRGGLAADGNCTLWYVDFFDIFRFLDAAHSGVLAATYNKTVDVPTR